MDKKQLLLSIISLGVIIYCFKGRYCLRSIIFKPTKSLIAKLVYFLY